MGRGDQTHREWAGSTLQDRVPGRGGIDSGGPHSIYWGFGMAKDGRPLALVDPASEHSWEVQGSSAYESRTTVCTDLRTDSLQGQDDPEVTQ